MCNFLREILTTLYNEQMLTLSWDEDEQMSEETRKEVKNLRIVKESFLVSFFQMILCEGVQKIILNTNEPKY